MKKTLISLLSLLCIGSLNAQSYRKTKKSDWFGTVDTRALKKFGLQLQAGPTYTFTKNKSSFERLDDGIGRTNFLQDPQGNVGVFAEVGLAHFNLKKPRFKFIPMIHYYDYGVGFKLFTGSETTTIQTLDLNDKVLEETKNTGSFANGYVNLRASAHHLIYFGKGARFLDFGLGFNGDYLVMKGPQSYVGNLSHNQKFSPDFRFMMHFDFGFGIRLKRGSYLIPGVQVPIWGISAFGQESIYWFSNKYYPAMFKLKWIYLFTNRGGRDCFQGSEEDRKRNQEYMQNK